MKIRAIVFDLGNTLIYQVNDSNQTLDKLHLTLMPDVKSALETLRCGHRLGILTNTERSNSRHVWTALEKLSVASCFDAVETSIDIGRKKPDLMLFRHILKKLDSDPRQAIMIGNDLVEDIRPAKRLGMSAAYFTKDPESSAEEADFRFSSFLHLATLLEEFEHGEPHDERAGNTSISS